MAEHSFQTHYRFLPGTFSTDCAGGVQPILHARGIR